VYLFLTYCRLGLYISQKLYPTEETIFGVHFKMASPFHNDFKHNMQLALFLIVLPKTKFILYLVQLYVQLCGAIN
jgi:hypothetical protein